MNGLEAILYSVLHNFVHETKFHGVEFSPCVIMLALQMFQILENFEIRDAQPVSRMCHVA